MKRRSKLLAVVTSAAVVGTLGVLGITSAMAATAGPIKGLGGKCIDVAAASSANGAHVQLYDCNGTSAQNWTVGDDGTIRALGKCMDVTAASTANGAKIQIYDCNGTNAQKWTASGSTLVNTGSGKCLSQRQPATDLVLRRRRRQPAVDTPGRHHTADDTAHHAPDHTADRRPGHQGGRAVLLQRLG
jgi:hypothetical protein